jgi:ABC-type transport system involved in cytochrome c biogenesis ATPase subunit
MLKIQNLLLYTQNDIVLSIPNISFEQGQLIYIQGDNSTGKSLFLKTLAGRYKNFKGQVSLKRESIDKFQNTNNIILIDSELPVLKENTYLQNIQLPFSKLSLTQKNRLIEIATLLNMMELLNVKMITSSSSQRIAMYLMRAAMISPSLMLIDDIDTFFDKDGFERVQLFLQFCVKSGIIIIMAGKSKLENFSSYVIKAKELVKV